MRDILIAMGLLLMLASGTMVWFTLRIGTPPLSYMLAVFNAAFFLANAWVVLKLSRN